MSKFNIGDKVKALDKAAGVYYYTRGSEFLGQVVSDEPNDAGDFRVKILEGAYGGIGSTFRLKEAHFVLADEVETFDYFSQTIEELVAENVSLDEQIVHLRARLAKKEAFFQQNKREIKGRIKPAL